jgi:hypothetical protein
MNHAYGNIMEAIRRFKPSGIKVRCVLSHSSENIRYRCTELYCMENEASGDIKRRAVLTRCKISLFSYQRQTHFRILQAPRMI